MAQKYSKANGKGKKIAFEFHPLPGCARDVANLMTPPGASGNLLLLVGSKPNITSPTSPRHSGNTNGSTHGIQHQMWKSDNSRWTYFYCTYKNLFPHKQRRHQDPYTRTCTKYPILRLNWFGPGQGHSLNTGLYCRKLRPSSCCISSRKGSTIATYVSAIC